MKRFMLGVGLMLVSLMVLTAPAKAGDGLGGMILHTPVASIPEDQPITFETSFTVPVEKAYLNYRLPGQASYIHFEMVERNDGKYFAYLKNVKLKKGDYFDYYVSADLQNGTEITQPAENPELMPHQVIISTKSVFAQSGIEVVALSPEPDSKVNQGDVVIAFSLFADSINVKNLRLKINNEDVTSKADVTAELVSYSPKNLDKGPYVARLSYRDDEEWVNLQDISFQVVKEGGEDVLASKGFKSAAALSQPGGQSEFEDGTFRANFRSEYKAQNNLGEKTNYSRAGADIGYEKKWFQVSASYDYDSEDDPRKNQPLTRYLVTANLDNMVIANYGDTYPTFSPVTLNGTRVRGISGGIFLGIFNLEYVQGEVNRKVVSKKDQGYISALDAAINGAANDTLRVKAAQDFYADPANKDNLFSGTFKRDLVGGRFSIGPQAFQIGFSAVKIKDDVGSLLNNPIASIGFQGSTPVENFVAGADFRTSMFSQRFNLDASVASGISNTNTIGGSLEEKVFSDAGIDLKQAQIDQLSQFITVNPNLYPIVTKFDKNLLAYTAGASLNVFNNNFSARYRYNGTFYRTLGASLTGDLETIELSDRVRLWQNRLFVSGSFASQKNNLDNSKINTLAMTNIGTNISLFLPNQLPSLTVGFNAISRDNSFGYDTTEYKKSALPEDNKTNVISVSSTYSFKMINLKNSATVNYSTSNKKDNSKTISDQDTVSTTFLNYYTPVGNAKSNTVGLSVSTEWSEWKLPLRTTAGISVSSGATHTLLTDSASLASSAGKGKIGKAASSATSMNASGDYAVFADKDLRLNTYGGFGFSSVKLPGIAAITLTSINAGSRLNFFVQHTVTINVNITSGLKVPKFNSAGVQTGSKAVTNNVASVRYDFVF